MKQSWKQMHLDYTRDAFSKEYKKWANKGYHDDRTFYCVRYESILSAIESMPEEPNNYICVAVNSQLHKDYDTLKRIIKNFEGR